MDQEVVGITAFVLEEKDKDDSLSVNWLEFLKCIDRVSEIAEIQRILAGKMNKVSKNSRIAVLNVAQSLAAIDRDLKGKSNVTVLHSPTRVEGRWDDPSHSGIYGLPRKEDRLTAATALRDAITEVHPASPVST